MKDYIFCVSATKNLIIYIYNCAKSISTKKKHMANGFEHKINHIGQWEGGLLIKKAENHGFIRLLIFEGLAPSSDEPQHHSSSIQKASIQH